MVKYTSCEVEEITLVKEVTVSASAGANTVNVFQLEGTVRVTEQVAEITEVTTLTNCTAVYATLYDGTNTVNLTADGATLSGLPVGTVFTKDKDVTETYSVLDASQCRVNEVVDDKKIGKPFTITQKNGANTYIRLHFTTTDDPISFKILLKFKYVPIDGGSLTWLV